VAKEKPVEEEESVPANRKDDQTQHGDAHFSVIAVVT
jgi:hypothetical protein